MLLGDGGKLNAAGSSSERKMVDDRGAPFPSKSLSLGVLSTTLTSFPLIT